jgi:hypothetical protein
VSKLITRAILIISALAIVGLYAISHPFVDFIVYWSAGHLFVAHGDPYSLQQVFAFQKVEGWTGPVPLMLLSPPWVLPIVALLGFSHSYVISWVCCFLILTASAAIASRLLMNLYFGSITIPEISDPPSYRYLFAFTFYPVLLALKFTQMAPLLLLGIAGFLYFRHREEKEIAGAFLSLTLLKPHLFLLLWLALLLRREWRVLLLALCPVAALTGITLFWYPSAFESYRALMSGPFPTIAFSGILSGIRSALGSRDTFWIQYIPPAIGLAWFCFYYLRHRAQWSWTDRLPALIAASVICAPYGYAHDQSLFMVPIISMAAIVAKFQERIPMRLVAIYTLMNVSILLVAIYSTPWCVIPGPILLVATMLYFKRAYSLGVKPFAPLTPIMAER